MSDAAASKLSSMFATRGFWAQLNPDLSIRDDYSFDDAAPWELPASDEQAFRVQLDRDGYVQLPRVLEPALSARLAAAASKLASIGVPPIFCMVYDDFWTPAFRLRKVMKAAFGAEGAILPALWVWHIDPVKSESGWRPHREVGYEALFPDRRPRALSAWIALTQATPLNGCMYVVPADRDPTYGTANDIKHEFALGDIRALPAEPGDILLWNQALLHWGGHASERAAAPRVSMSFEFMHAGEEPYYRPVVEPRTIQRFEDRLKLIGRQILRYRHLYELPPQLEALARTL
jgi:hypothetical protein